MNNRKSIWLDISEVAGTIEGNAASKSIQNATDETFRGLDLFLQAAGRKKNLSFDQAKGNLFEYIETVKFNRNAATKGAEVRAVVTDSIGRPHDPADIELLKNNEVVKQVQAKFSDSANAVVDSVYMQRNPKYDGMQRLIRKEEHYYGKGANSGSSLLEQAKDLARKASEREGSIYQEQYKDVYENLTDELHYDAISSGGTTLEELREAYELPDKYVAQFEKRQVGSEMAVTSKNMAKASFVTTGVVSGISNLFQVFSDRKDLATAVHDVGADAVESGIRGGATGILSTAIRTKGIKAGNKLLSDSTASTVMAGGMIDGGVALLAYAKGEIDEETLRDELIDTVAKSTTTIYYTKAVGAILGKSMSPIFPVAVYTTANYLIADIRAIIREANLEAEEYRRMTALLEESIKTKEEYLDMFMERIEYCEHSQKRMFDNFISSFDYDISTGENYEAAINTIVQFADQAGIALQHVGFEDFRAAMNSDDPFVLK